MAKTSTQTRTLLFAAFLAFQALIPLRYYLGSGGDDERFSWRMFSTRRMLQCRMDIEELTGMGPRAQRTQVLPQLDVQVAWLEVLRRNRPAAVQRYLERRCDISKADSVKYTRSCVQSDGEQMPEQQAILHCESGRFEVEEGS